MQRLVLFILISLGLISADSSIGTVSKNRQIAYSDSFCSFETDFLPKGIDGHNCENQIM